MIRRPRHLAALIALCGCMAGAPPAMAEAPAPWPEAARGRPLPRPAWVLVVAARRTSDGNLVIWDRADPWTKAWRVPKLVSGIRMVSLFGDAEDRRSVTAEAIDGMLVDSLSVVMRKYGAPALALAVSDGDGVSLAGYVPGSAASWQTSELGAGVEDTRARSLATLAAMFTGRGEARGRSGAVADEARVTGVRDNASGGEEYKVAIAPSDGSQGDVAGRLRGLRDARLVSIERDGTGYEAVIEADAGYAPLVDSLRAAGFSVR